MEDFSTVLFGIAIDKVILLKYCEMHKLKIFI